MGRLKLGAVIWPSEDLTSGVAPSWHAIRDAAVVAEQVGFDTVWIPDELQWETAEAEGPRGWWECVALTSAVAEATTTIDIGTWVLSALHRNPGLTVRVAETIDEISAGRFILGYGAGHAGRQGEAFGFPPEKTVGRYEEALTIVSDLLRTGSSSFSGEYHSTLRQSSAPRGPRPGSIPLVLGGHGPRTMRLAVTYADTWSAYATNSSEAVAFASLIEEVISICETQERDPSTLSRSIGINVRSPGTPSDVPPLGPSLVGTEQEIVRSLEQFTAVGATHVEIIVPGDMASGFERLAGVVEKIASA